MTKPDSLEDLVERAAAAPRHLLEPFFKETAKEVLVALSRNPNLKKIDLLRLLERKDLSADAIKEIAAHKEAAKNYAVWLAIARHPKTPRLISLPLLKFLYLFDLVRVCQTPAVPPHVKVVAEETILSRFDSIARGEKITLARRGPGRVAAALLVSDDRELIRASLDNPYLSEAHLMRALSLEELPVAVVEEISQDEKWSHSYHVRLSLIRNPRTPLPRVLLFIPDMAVNDLRDICLDRRMPDQVRKYVLAHCAVRLAKKPVPQAAVE